MLETPVVLLIFNRPDLTAQVFERIAAQQPRRLLVVADGPRDEAERTLCEQTRAIIRVDWPCELETHFSETNLGCRVRVSSGLDWAFERVEAAIILEDDCLPHPDFFVFCEAMLKRYRNDSRIMHISGDNFVPEVQTPYSHYFSRAIHIWGWATWRRAWNLYDVAMKQWPSARDDILALCADEEERRHWGAFFNRVHSGEIDTWDIQWVYTCWLQSGLAVVPRCNLISNLGFREDATHTHGSSPFSNLPTHPWQDIESELLYMIPNHQADALDRRLWVAPSFKNRWRNRISNRIKRLLPKQ